MDGYKGLQEVLDQVYTSMIGQSNPLIGVAQGIAGFAALWFIGVRVWRHLGKAEPIDLFPLLRPFAIGVAIALFPDVIGLINGIMGPAVTATSKMQENATASIAALLKQKEDALKGTIQYQMYVGPNGEGNEALWEQYSGDASSSVFSGISNAFKFAMDRAFYNFRNAIKVWLSEVLELLFEAAALCINTIRTFNLVVLAIIGPLAFGLSIFDGFGNTLREWLARYINVFLWLPVANIFGSIIATIQVFMLKLDINQINSSGGTYFSKTDTGYLIFLVIGIVGYSLVPSVAGHIVRVGGSGDPMASRTGGLLKRVTSGFKF